MTRFFLPPDLLLMGDHKISMCDSSEGRVSEKMIDEMIKRISG